MLVLLASKYISLGHFIIPSIVGSKEATKEYWGFCQRTQVPTWTALLQQRWDNMSINKDSNCNGLKNIKYV